MRFLILQENQQHIENSPSFRSKESDRQRLTNDRKIEDRVIPDQVAVGLFRIGAIALTELDVCDRFRAMAAAGRLQAGLSLLIEPLEN